MKTKDKQKNKSFLKRELKKFSVPNIYGKKITIRLRRVEEKK